MKIKYHEIMYKINSFIFGTLSGKAHKHLGAFIAMGIKEGMNNGKAR